MLLHSKRDKASAAGTGAGRATSVFTHGALVFAGSSVLSLGGFVFHAVASRMLGVAAYGALYTLISLNAVAALPGAVLNPVVSRFAAEFRVLQSENRLSGLERDLRRLCIFSAAAYAVLGLALAVAATWLLGLPLWALPVLGGVAASTFAVMVVRGLALGMQDFRSYAVSASIEGIGKVLALLALAALGLRLAGGILGFFAGTACGLGIVLWTVRRRLAGIIPRTPRYDWRRIARSSTGAAAMIVATNCIGSVDVVLVRHFFSVRDAGLYSAASLAGRAVLYLVNFAPMVMLPSVTDRFARGDRTRAPFWQTLAMLLALALCAVLALALEGTNLLHALVGNAFDDALPLLTPYAVAMMLLATTNLVASYGLATHRLSFAAPFILGAAGTLGVIAVSHPSLLAVTRELLAGNAITCVAVAAAQLAQTRLRTATRPS